MPAYANGFRQGRFGNRLRDQRLLWSPIYESVLSILGNTGLIIPMGDTNDENAGRTTVTTRGEEQVVFTYSEAVTAFDTIPSFLGPARVPLITFNASDEEADTPDAAFWSRDDAGGANGFSIGFWANVVDTAIERALLTKFDQTTGVELREWQFVVESSDSLLLELWDESVNVAPNRRSDAAIIMGTMTFFVATYDGTGGATAASGITLYQNGSVLASTPNEQATYVGMEDLATTVGLGAKTQNNGVFTASYNGSLTGGPLGPFWAPTELTADAVLRLYQLGRAVLDI